VVQLGGNTDGVYIHDARDLSFISYFQQTYCDPEEVLFGQNTELLHVLGGTASTTNPADPKGVVYSLDMTDPFNPTLVFLDTLNTIWGLGISNPRNAVIKNDTLYVATTAAFDVNWQFPDPAAGHVYVYDVSDTSNLNLITTIYAGLWHFDVDIQDTILYVASEWYGVQTMGIGDIFNATELGLTLKLGFHSCW